MCFPQSEAQFSRSILREAALLSTQGFCCWMQLSLMPFLAAQINTCLFRYCYYMYYNFCKVHQTLRVTPAMEAGLTDHVWSLQELLGLQSSGYGNPFARHA
jgi:hypothetical protein